LNFEEISDIPASLSGGRSQNEEETENRKKTEKTWEREDFESYFSGETIPFCFVIRYFRLISLCLAESTFNYFSLFAPVIRRISCVFILLLFRFFLSLFHFGKDRSPASSGNKNDTEWRIWFYGLETRLRASNQHLN